jgi:hypothetical protein
MDNLTKEGFPYNSKSIFDKGKIDYSRECVKYLRTQASRISQVFIEGVHTNRKYVDTIQDQDQLVNQYNSQTEDGLVSYVDLDFTPVGISKIIFKAIYDKINSVKNFNMVEARDPNTMAYKKYQLADMRARIKVSKLVGIDLTGGNLPDSEMELDVYEKMFGLTTPVETVLQEILKEVDYQNKLEHDVVPMTDYDLIAADIAAIHTFYDENGLIKEEPIDITRLKIFGGKKRDYSDAYAFAISDQINKDDLFSLIEEQYINGPEDNKNEYTRSVEEFEATKLKINGLAKEGMVDIETFYWVAYDTNVKEVLVKGGEMSIRNRPLTAKGGNMIKKSVHKWYSCVCVSNTTIMYNYGPVKNMIRERYNQKYGKALCPITVIRVSQYNLTIQNSIIFQIRKFDDMATNAWLKLQNELSNAKSSGREYNLQTMANALQYTDFKKVSEMVDYAEKTGTIFGASTDDFNRPNNAPAMREMRGGVSPAFMDYWNIMRQAKDWAHEMSGTPVIDTGGQQDKEISKFATQGMLSGSNKLLRQLIEAKHYLMKTAGEKKLNMILRYAHPANKMPFPYKSEFSDVKKYVLDLIGDMSVIEIGLRIEQDYTEEEKERMINDAITLSQRFRDSTGNDGLSIVEYLNFRELMKDNAKFAGYYLGVLIDKRKREAQEVAMKQAEQNAQFQQQSAMMNNEGKMAIEQQAGQNEMQTAELKHNLQLRNNLIQQEAAPQQ